MGNPTQFFFFMSQKARTLSCEFSKKSDENRRAAGMLDPVRDKRQNGAAGHTNLHAPSTLPRERAQQETQSEIYGGIGKF